MDQVDSESRVVTAVDSTPKKLARQLDFSPMYKVPTANVVLPNHPQARLQLKIEAKVKPKVQPQTQPQPQLQAPQPQQVQVVRPIVRPPEVQMRPPHQVPVFQRDFSHPAPRQPLPAIHFEPKETQSIIKTEEKDVTPKKPKQCNCKNSKCLKLYCECFSAGVYCDGCNCSNCHNNIEHEPARQEAVTAALDRNPNAFRPKIAKSPHMPRNGKVETGDSAIAAKHNKGCHCKKSGCLKKYCECFQGNIPCSENCRCVDCKNCEGSEERRSLGYGDSPTPTIYYQPQATNAVVKEALGHYSYRITQVSKKRKNPEPAAFNPVQQNAQFLQRADYAAEFHKQENERNSSGLSSPANPLTPGSSKIAFSSLMADIIQPQFIKDLCSDMVVASAEIVKTHTENTDARQRGVAEVDHKAITTTQQRDAKTKDTNAEVSARADNTVSNQADGEFTSDIGSTSGEVQNERPMSPGMLALMCDETDTAFTLESEKRCQENEKASNFNSELHAKQEKIILTKFRDFLNHLIVCASVKESMHNNVRVQTEHVGTQNGTKASNNTIVRPQLPSSNPSATNGVIIRPPQLTASNPSGSSNSIIFRPQLPTSNPNNSVIFRPQLPTSNPNASNGVVIRPQAPTINHSVINSSTTSQLVTSSSSAANTSSSSSYKQPESHHSETSREESSLIK